MKENELKDSYERVLLETDQNESEYECDNTEDHKDLLENIKENDEEETDGDENDKKAFRGIYGRNMLKNRIGAHFLIDAEST